MKKSTILSLVAVLFLVVVLGSFANVPDSSQVVRAGVGENVSGWAWSDNIGWISFNCLDREVAENKICLDANDASFNSADNLADYGVNIDYQTGDFSGYAWSDNIGWISFAPTGPYPENPQEIAKLSTDGTTITGWARACAGAANVATCSGGANPNAGGWDGWIKLSGISPIDGSSYGVTINNNDFFDGYAWGDVVIGWIDFSGFQNNNGVKVGNSVPPVGVSVGEKCNDGIESPDDADSFTDREDPNCYTYDSNNPSDSTLYVYDGSLFESPDYVECFDWIDNDGDARYDATGIYFDSMSGGPVNDSNGKDLQCDTINDTSESTLSTIVCGDGFTQTPVEICDPADPPSYSTRTCVDEGFTSTGNVDGCYDDTAADPCTFDTSSCTGAGCNNNGTCDTGETAFSCASDCFKFEEF